MNQKPILTYTEEGQIWDGIKDEFINRFPLRNLTFVNPTRGEQQTIASLDLEFKKYHPEMFPKFVPGALQYNSFFVHLFLLSSEDVEMYKSTTKKLMQDWWNVVASKKNQEWIVVCVSGGQVQKSRKFAMLGGTSATVYERIKSDLNIKKDRVFQVGMSSSDPKNLESWNDLIIKIKECVVGGVSSQILQYEEDARRLEQQRLVPGWNYCQYFIMKEALSSTFEMLTLYRDALVHYDELEATFYQTLEEQGAPWFKKFGGNEPTDDNQDIFNLSNKNYRDLIIQNAISIFDFRMYLFSRQVALLNIQKSPVEICQRAKLFISSFSRTLFEYRDSLVPFFREAWVYSMVTNILRYCDELLAISNFPSNDVVVYEGLKGELYLSARYQLDKLGVASKLLSHSLHCEPLEISDIENVQGLDITAPDEFKLKFSNDALKQIMQSKTSFDASYEKISQKCFRSFEICKRPGTVLFLKADLAFLHFARQNYAKAAEIFEEICFSYADNGWNHIDTILIERFAICQRQLQRTKNLVRSYLHLVQFPAHLILETTDYYLEQLKDSAKNGENGYKAINNNLLKLVSLRIVDDLCTNEPVKAEVVIYSNFPQEFFFDDLVLVFSAADGAEMNFKSSSLTFQPGNNTVQLTAKRSTIPGKYSGKEVRVRYQKLEFIVQVPSKLHKRAILDIERSGSSLELFQLTPSSNVNQKSLDLIITTGDIELGNPDIEFLCMTSIDLDLKKPLEFSIACSETTTTWTQSCVNGKVTLPRVERGSVIKTSLDYRIPGEKSVDHIVKLILRDHLENQNKIMYSKVVHLQLSRPFELNYSLRHNAKCSLLQCCFIGQENLPVRIGKISWEPKESVTAMVPQENGILFPQQRIQFGALLKLEKKEDLKISIEYQSVTKEIEHYIIDRCNHHCKAENVPLVAGVLKRFVKRHVFPLIKPFDLCYFGILRLQELEIEPIVNSLVNVSEKQQNHVREAIKKLNRDLVLIQDTDINQSFNGLTPQKVVYQEPVSPCNVLITPKWISGNETKEVQVGETLPFTLVVSPTIWRSDMQVKALLTIQQDSGRLAIGGKQKVEMKFEKETDSFEIPITIIPLKPGLLYLPVLEWKLEEALDGVFFEDQNDQTGVSVIPVEESCRRYLPETIEQ